MIKTYHFGSIIIDGKTYNKDVEVRWTDEVLVWWRREGHIVDVDDVERAISQKPTIIIIGTGEMGVAQVTQNCQNFIKQKDIQLIIGKTEEAVRTFNDILKKENRVIGLFHLTC